MKIETDGQWYEDDTVPGYVRAVGVSRNQGSEKATEVVMVVQLPADIQASVTFTKEAAHLVADMLHCAAREIEVLHE